ncbi:MAG: flagellar biosynthesis repressor FlbT [Hyphomicrobiaceae bacterium]
MKKGFRINLRAGEKIYINGAVLCVDRKVSLEFLNDVAFLLESHVLSPDETTTPLRQLYYMIQTMLIEPGSAAAARGMFDATLPQLLATFNNRQVLEGLGGVRSLVAGDRLYEALKLIRSLFPIEDAILAATGGADAKTYEVAQ